MALQRIDPKVQQALASVRAGVAAKHDRRALEREMKAKHEAQREERYQAFVAKHGSIVWRAMRFYNDSEFVQSVLGWFQASGDMTWAQVEGLQKTVPPLERRHGVWE